MSVENSKIIDYITNSNDSVVLTISDHLEWNDGYEHVFLLQEKINAYIMAIESKQLSSYFKSSNDKVTISVALKYAPNDIGIRFFKEVQKELLNAGYKFDYYIL